MEQDINKVLDNLSAEWAQDAANAKRKIAILQEENRLLREENEQLKEGKEADAE
ncbi:hypothetical protein [Lentibacillus salicampi]|uniref:hypothetical protein n=1 Tax=Lentibacillus salicampi TaxID=175306 RepID=UPI0014310E00|nr:hypothetical protein [Lentibacillus salicampi]